MTGKGFGVNTLQHITKGTFIAVYAGEILSEEDAAKRLAAKP